MASASKRLPNTERMPNVAWAWEFLRRNTHYRRCYDYWNSGRQSDRRYTPDEAENLLLHIEELGALKDRFLPWGRAVIASGFPYAQTVCFVRRGTQFVFAAELVHDEEQELDVGEDATEAMIVKLAATQLDPLNFLLDEWLDYRLKPREIGIEQLSRCFRRDALLMPKPPAEGSYEQGVARFLGLLKPPSHEDQSIPDIFNTIPMIDTGSGAAVDQRLEISFDIRAPIEPQIGEARRSLLELQSRLRTDRNGIPADVKAVVKPDTKGLYSVYRWLLDERETVLRGRADVQKRWLYEHLSTQLRRKHPGWAGKELPFALEMNLYTADYLCESGYRHLAFL